MNMSLGTYLFMPFLVSGVIMLLVDVVPPLWNEWQYRREKDAFHRAGQEKAE